MNGNPIFVRTGSDEDKLIISRHQELANEESAKYRGAPYVVADQGKKILLVGGLGTTVFGSLSAILDTSTSCRIQHVFVEQAAREVGVGDSLLRALIEICRESEITWVAASAQPGDRAMKNLFERHGLVAQTILVGKSLSGPSTEERASQ